MLKTETLFVPSVPISLRLILSVGGLETPVSVICLLYYSLVHGDKKFKDFTKQKKKK